MLYEVVFFFFPQSDIWCVRPNEIELLVPDDWEIRVGATESCCRKKCQRSSVADRKLEDLHMKEKGLLNQQKNGCWKQVCISGTDNDKIVVGLYWL